MHAPLHTRKTSKLTTMLTDRRTRSKKQNRNTDTRRLTYAPGTGLPATRARVSVSERRDDGSPQLCRAGMWLRRELVCLCVLVPFDLHADRGPCVYYSTMWGDRSVGYREKGRLNSTDSDTSQQPHSIWRFGIRF